jgi:hypothetical protein
LELGKETQRIEKNQDQDDVSGGELWPWRAPKVPPLVFFSQKGPQGKKWTNQGGEIEPNPELCSENLGLVLAIPSWHFLFSHFSTFLFPIKTLEWGKWDFGGGLPNMVRRGNIPMDIKMGPEIPFLIGCESGLEETSFKGPLSHPLVLLLLKG